MQSQNLIHKTNSHISKGFRSYQMIIVMISSFLNTCILVLIKNQWPRSWKCTFFRKKNPGLIGRNTVRCYLVFWQPSTYIYTSYERIPNFIWIPLYSSFSDFLSLIEMKFWELFLIKQSTLFLRYWVTASISSLFKRWQVFHSCSKTPNSFIILFLLITISAVILQFPFLKTFSQKPFFSLSPWSLFSSFYPQDFSFSWINWMQYTSVLMKPAHWLIRFL